MLLARAVENIAYQAASELAIFDLGDRAKGAGQSDVLSDNLGQLHRGGGDQPDLLASLDM